MKKMKKDETNPVETQMNTSDMMGMFGNMMNQGMMQPNMVPPEIPADGTIIDAEDGEIVSQGSFEEENAIEVDNNSDMLIITSVAPLGITDKVDEEKTVVLLYLCTTNQDNKMLILKRKIGLESKDDIEIILDNPLYDGMNFIHNKTITGVLLSSLPSFYTELDFDLADDYKYNEKTLLRSYYYDNDNQMIDIFMPIDIFGSIAYIEYYTFCAINNKQALTEACIFGVNGSQNNKGFFNIEEIEELVYAAPAIVEDNSGLFKKKVKTPDLAVVAKVSRSIEQDGHLVKDFAYVLFSVVPEKTYPNSKFKGNDIKNIKEKYYGDNDQFIARYMIGECRFFNIDKNYMLIKAVSKNGDGYMFMFDESICNKLERLIDAY